MTIVDCDGDEIKVWGECYSRPDARTAGICVAQIEVANTYLEVFVKQISQAIVCYVEEQQLEKDVKLPWGYRLYAGGYDPRIIVNATAEQYAQFVTDIEAGWLDRVEAMFAAPTKAARTQILKERGPWDVPSRAESKNADTES